MPGKNGTGPLGRVEATGRGMGSCVTPGRRIGRRGMGRGAGVSAGAGFGFGRGMGFCRVPLTEAEEKEWLKREKEMLTEELNYIQQLETGLEKNEDK